MPFKDIPKYEPPLADGLTERKLNSLKTLLHQEYKSVLETIEKKNGKNSEMAILKNLKKKRASMTFKLGDKSKGFAVLRTEGDDCIGPDFPNYKEKCLEHLADTNVYEIVKGPLTESKNRICKCINSLSDHLPAKVLSIIKPNYNTKLAEFYGLVKDHKENFPIRPICSAINSPPEKLSFIVTEILKQCVKLIPSVVKNSVSFLSKFKEKYSHAIPETWFYFSLDVTSMYTNIPIEECKTECLSFIINHKTKLNLFGLDQPQLEDLLHAVFYEGYFRFGENKYHQKMGLAMGMRHSPPAANIFMYMLESRIINEWNSLYESYQLQLWDRCLDDIIDMWKYGMESFELFVVFVNESHETIKFTYEDSCESGKIDFMDLTLGFDSGRNITSELFIKPTNSGVTLHYESNHPLKVKLNTAKNHFLRALKLSSGPNEIEKSFNLVSLLLKCNGYPPHIIEMNKNLVANNDNINENTSGMGTNNSKDNKLFLTLPFVNEKLLNKCATIVKDSGIENIMLANKPGKSLKDYLVSTQFSPPKCHSSCMSCLKSKDSFVRCDRKLIIYELICKLCNESYIGQSARVPHKRVYEHNSAIINEEDDKAISTHFLEEHNTTDRSCFDFEFKILRYCINYLDMMIAEAELIRLNKPSINKYAGKWKLLN